MHWLQIRYAAALIMIFLSGCQQGSDANPTSASASKGRQVDVSSPRVGIVDMQRLSVALGISEQLTEKRKKLQADWDRLNAKAREEIENKLKSLGGDPDKVTEEGKRELQTLELEQRRRLAVADRDNTAALQETNRWLRRVLLEKTRGPIDAIGKEQGFDLILVQSPGEIAYIRPGVDVTSLVLKRAGGKAAVPEQDVAEPQADGVPDGSVQ